MVCWSAYTGGTGGTEDKRCTRDTGGTGEASGTGTMGGTGEKDGSADSDCRSDAGVGDVCEGAAARATVSKV